MKAIQPIFGNKDNVHIIHDDLIIASPSIQSRDTAFETVLQKIFDLGLTLHPEKCAFRLDKVPFYVFSKMDFLQETPPPQNNNQIKFIPNL